MTKEEAIKKIKAGISIKEVSDFYDDIDVMSEAVKIDWKNIKYASSRLKKNKTIALLALKNSELALKQIDESLQDDKDILVKAFDTSHKIAVIKPELLSDLDYLERLLKVGSSEHKIVEMLSSEILEKYAVNVYPYIKKALTKINYQYSDGFTVRSLMYNQSFAKGLLKNKFKVEFDYRMKEDIDIVNAEQLYSLIAINNLAEFNFDKIFEKIAITDSLLTCQYLFENSLINNIQINMLKDLASRNNATKVMSYLLIHGRNNSVDPREELLFLLENNDNEIKTKGYSNLIENLYNFDSDFEVIEKFLESRPSDYYKDLVFDNLKDGLMNLVDNVEKLMDIDREVFKYTSLEVKSNKEFIKKLVRDNSYQLSFLVYIDEELKSDNEFLAEIFNINTNIIKFVGQELLLTKDNAMKALANDYSIFNILNEDLRSDEEIYEIALRHGANFNYLPTHLRSNKKLFELALSNCNYYSEILNSASDDIRCDKELVLKTLNKNNDSFKHVCEYLRNDIDVVYAALGISIGSGLRFRFREYYFDEELPRHFGFDEDDELEYAKREYLETEDCKNLEYVGSEIRKNKDLMGSLIKSNPFLIRFAEDILKEDKSLIEDVLLSEPICIKYIDKSYLNNLDEDRKKYYQQFLNPSIQTLKDADKIIEKNINKIDNSKELPELAKEIASSPYKYNELSPENKKNIDLLSMIIKLNPNSIHSMWDAPEQVFLKAIEQDASIVEDLYKTKKHSEKFMLKAIERNPKALEYALKSMQTKRGFVLEAVAKNGNVLEFVQDKFKKDAEIVLAAVRNNPMAYMYADITIIKNKDNAQVIYEALKNINYFANRVKEKFDTVFEYNYNSKNNKPENFGKKWSAQHEELLVNEYKKEKDIDSIAKEIGRDTWGCLVKLYKLNVIDDKKMEQLLGYYDPERTKFRKILLSTLGIVE